jgi:hypothetical protein
MPLEIIAGAVVGAAVANPSIRNAIRQGMIRGLGSLLVAYDKAAAAVQEAAKAARDGAASASAAAPAPANVPAPAAAPGGPAPTAASTAPAPP